MLQLFGWMIENEFMNFSLRRFYGVVSRKTLTSAVTDYANIERSNWPSLQDLPLRHFAIVPSPISSKASKLALEKFTVRSIASCKEKKKEQWSTLDFFFSFFLCRRLWAPRLRFCLCVVSGAWNYFCVMERLLYRYLLTQGCGARPGKSCPDRVFNGLRMEFHRMILRYFIYGHSFVTIVDDSTTIDLFLDQSAKCLDTAANSRRIHDIIFGVKWFRSRFSWSWRTWT